MWNHTYGCANHYRCALAIYILPCIALEFSIIVDRIVEAPGHKKDMVDVMNYIDKWMLKLAITKLLNTELIIYDPIIFKFIQVHEEESVKL